MKSISNNGTKEEWFMNVQSGRDEGFRPKWGVRLFKAIDQGLERIEKFVMSWSIIALSVISIANVVSRTLFDWGFTFIEEVSQFIVIMVTFLEVGYAVRNARHIRMSAFYDLFNEKVRKVLIIIISAITSAVLFYLTFYSVKYVMNTARIGVVTPIIRFPLWLVYIWVPIGLFVGGVHYALTIFKNLRSPGVYLSIEKEDAYEDEDFEVTGI